MNNFKLLKGYTDNSRVVHIDINHLPEDNLGHFIERMRRVMIMSSGIPQRFLNPPVTQVTIDVRLPGNINQ
jgi:esterase/lipase superfamily enzyme